MKGDKGRSYRCMLHIIPIRPLVERADIYTCISDRISAPGQYASTDPSPYYTDLTVRTEFAGTLLGFDDYVNMVLEDVIEL